MNEKFKKLLGNKNMKKCIQILILSILLCGIYKVAEAECPAPPASCEAHCSGWPTSAERQECTTACIQLGLQQEWTTYHNECLAREAADKQAEDARKAREQQQAQEWQAEQARQQAARQAQEQQARELQAELERQLAAQQATQQQQQNNPPPPQQPVASPQPNTPPEGKPLPVTVENIPAPAPEPTDVKYMDIKDIKKGDSITAPPDKKIDILTGDGKIDLKEGSVLTYVSENLWQLVKGTVHFAFEHVKQRGIKVRTPNAVCSVRGTQFTTEITPNGDTKVTVTKGIVNVAPTARGQKAVDVKEGFQITIAKSAPGKSVKQAKPTKIDTAKIDKWYESIPASQGFFDSSWQKEASASQYKRECVFSAGKMTPGQILTEDEQKLVDDLNKNIPQFRVKTTDTIIEKDKKLSSGREKNTVAGKASMQLSIDAKGIYYPGEKTNTWKTFMDKKMIEDIFKSARAQNLTYDFDKKTFVFEKWENNGKSRLAVYSAKLTPDGTDDIISTATGANSEDGQEVGTFKVYIDEETRLWSKGDITINVKSGKVIFPLKETCQITYGDTIKIVTPGAKAKKTDAKTGAVELNKIINSAR